MKTEAQTIRNWDDLVFENRHKEYGAYSIRQAYSRNMTIAFSATVTAALLVIFLPGLLPSPPTITDAGTIINQHTVAAILMQEPRVVNPKPEPQTKSVVPKSVSKQAPRVTRNEVVEAPPTVKQISEAPANGKPDGVEGAVEKPTTETGVVDAPAGPAIDPNKPFDIVEQMPTYEGGLQAMARFISKNVKYPGAARRMGTEGTVFVSFVINAIGQVIDVKVVKGISAECDKEAMRVIAMMPPWQAGVQNGTPVSVRMMMPIKFALGN